MRYSFHPAAKKEFYEVIDYYEDCQRGQERKCHDIF